MRQRLKGSTMWRDNMTSKRCDEGSEYLVPDVITGDTEMTCQVKAVYVVESCDCKLANGQSPEFTANKYEI